MEETSMKNERGIYYDDVFTGYVGYFDCEPRFDGVCYDSVQLRKIQKMVD